MQLTIPIIGNFGCICEPVLFNRSEAPIAKRSVIGQFHAKSVLPRKAVEEFKRIYKKSYGIRLSDEEATLKANNLVRLYQAVYSDLPFGRVELKKNAGHETQ